MIQQQKASQQIYSLVEYWNFNRMMDVCMIMKDAPIFYEQVQNRKDSMDPRQISFFLCLTYYVAILNGQLSLVKTVLS